MASLNDIKKRIGSVKSTKQITKAMEVVSATKMRRSQELALKARSYAFSAFELLAAASRKLKEGEQLPTMFSGNKSKKTLAIVIASDKGLAGSLNANIMRKAQKTIEELKSKGEVDLATVGKKTRDYFAFRKYPIVQEFIGHGDYVDLTEMNDLHEFISSKFLNETYGRVVFVYTNFLSTLRQEPVVRQVLPISEEGLMEMIEGLVPDRGRYSDQKAHDKGKTEENTYLFEPSRERVLKELVDRIFRMELYHIQLESNASEHSARMVAMKTASDNAAEIVDDLTLEYNKGRQAKITQEIVEITGGAEAVA